MNFLISLRQKLKGLFLIENIYYLSLIVSIFFLDRFSKLQIINNFSDTIYYVNDYINLNLIWNIGIGFGLLSTTSTLVYNLVTLLIGSVIIFLIYFFMVSKKIDKLIYSIILGGAVGNFYDRFAYKAVPDFVDIHYENFHWFTFNVADIFITIGILFYILRGYFEKT